MAYKIIVADTSPTVQRAVEHALPAPLFKLFPFNDGLKGIQAIPEIRPDAALVSFDLPSKSGYEVAAFLRSREDFRQAALFFLRGSFEPLDISQISQIDHDGIIQKPFDSGSLLRSVREAIEKKRDIPSLPEEPVLAESGQPASPPEKITTSVLEGLSGVDQKIRDAVDQEFEQKWSDLKSRMREIASSEFKKLLVKELKGIDDKK